MKKMDLQKMESLQGGIKPAGWTWSVEQHALCFVGGMIAGGGVLGALGYMGCLAAFIA
ncbi:MAG: hypothetical protein RSD40_01455 [Bacilli bacterium]